MLEWAISENVAREMTGEREERKEGKVADRCIGLLFGGVSIVVCFCGVLEDLRRTSKCSESE